MTIGEWVMVMVAMVIVGAVLVAWADSGEKYL